MAQIPSLDALRARIDSVDDGLHDLLMERARIVEEVARLKRSGEVPPFRPGREAQIVRRIVRRHRGAFPKGAVVRIWREILGAGIAMQTEFVVARTASCASLAREHFGGQAAVVEFDSAAEIVQCVREGGAAVGVVPMPSDPGESWWLDLAALPDDGPHIVARLPFGAPSEEDCQEAFVLAAMAPEPSGDDCSVFAVTLTPPLTLARLTDALLACGLNSAPLAEMRRADGVVALLMLDAFLAADDRRVAEALRPLGRTIEAVWLGAYPRPLPDAALDDRMPE